MSDEDHSTLKDVALGIIIGACLAVVFIRCIELYDRPDTAQTNVHTAQWVVVGSSVPPPCESGVVAF